VETLTRRSILRALAAFGLLPQAQSVSEPARPIDWEQAPPAAVDPIQRLRDLVLDPSVDPVLTFELPRR
jgi:hypothetical protein